MHERMNSITPGIVGLPIPKSPNLSTHANMAISITTLIPKRLRKIGMSRMQNASLICEMDVSNVALFAANDDAISWSVLPLKLVRKGPANPLVTCRAIPSMAENMKKSAIFLVLNSSKALRPNVSARERFSPAAFLTISQ